MPRLRLWQPEALNLNVCLQVGDWLKDLSELADWVVGWHDEVGGEGADGRQRAEVERDVWLQLVEEEQAARHAAAHA